MAPCARRSAPPPTLPALTCAAEANQKTGRVSRLAGFNYADAKTDSLGRSELPTLAAAVAPGPRP